MRRRVDFAFGGHPAATIFLQCSAPCRKLNVDLCGVLAGKGAAAMAAVPAVRIDNDLASGEARAPIGPPTTKRRSD